jgi:NAD(P)H-hydrate epimerase
VKAVTAEQMRELDRRAIAAGTPAEELMERAGFAVAKATIEFLKRGDSRDVLLFAGRGNNGGDAVVAARHLALAGCQPTLVVVEPRELPALAGVQILRWPCPLPAAAVVVDGLLGIGLKGEVREPYASAIQYINLSRLPVVAVDVPSGLGKTICVRADVTVTMGLPKIDLLKEPEVVGRIQVVDIGVGDDVETDIELITRADVELPERRRSAHKGDFGHLLIVAGSEGYTGAPVLAAHAAARAGAGLVTLAVPKDVYPIVAGKCPPEVMPRPLSFEQVPPGYDAVAIGPGLGQKPETQKLIWKLLSSSPVPTVVDADALNALAQAPSALKKLPVPFVLTPHPGEMARLVGKSVKEVQADRWEIARQFVRENGVALALKGAGTVVTDKSGKLWINSTGNPGMAKGGMGDALTGIIGALLSQKMTPLGAAKAGVFWHGLAGDVAADRCGQRSMLVTDLIEALGTAWHIPAA